MHNREGFAYLSSFYAKKPNKFLVICEYFHQNVIYLHFERKSNIEVSSLYGDFNIAECKPILINPISNNEESIFTVRRHYDHAVSADEFRAGATQRIPAGLRTGSKP